MTIKLFYIAYIILCITLLWSLAALYALLAATVYTSVFIEFNYTKYSIGVLSSLYMCISASASLTLLYIARNVKKKLNKAL